jgi:hypothetical protein
VAGASFVHRENLVLSPPKAESILTLAASSPIGYRGPRAVILGSAIKPPGSLKLI